MSTETAIYGFEKWMHPNLESGVLAKKEHPFQNLDFYVTDGYSTALDQNLFDSYLFWANAEFLIYRTKENEETPHSLYDGYDQRLGTRYIVGVNGDEFVCGVRITSANNMSQSLDCSNFFQYPRQVVPLPAECLGRLTFNTAFISEVSKKEAPGINIEEIKGDIFRSLFKRTILDIKNKYAGQMPTLLVAVNGATERIFRGYGAQFSMVPGSKLADENDPDTTPQQRNMVRWVKEKYNRYWGNKPGLWYLNPQLKDGYK